MISHNNYDYFSHKEELFNVDIPMKAFERSIRTEFF